MSDQHTRADAFLSASFPSQRELSVIERELKPRARSRPVTCMHGEIVWRVRRGEVVTVDRLAAIWPVIARGLWSQYVGQLRSWGVLSEADPILCLAEET